MAQLVQYFWARSQTSRRTRTPARSASCRARIANWALELSPPPLPVPYDQAPAAGPCCICARSSQATFRSTIARSASGASIASTMVCNETE